MATWRLLHPSPLHVDKIAHVAFPAEIQQFRRCHVSKCLAVLPLTAGTAKYKLSPPGSVRKFCLSPPTFFLRRSFFCKVSEQTFSDNSLDSDDESNGYISEDDWKLPESKKVKKEEYPIFSKNLDDIADDETNPPDFIAKKDSSVEDKTTRGLLVSLLLFLLLSSLLLTIDAYIWKLIPRPLSVLYLTLPFLISASLSAYLGFLSLPLLLSLKTGQILRSLGPRAHLPKAGTPTMGGLFFLPSAILVSWFVIGYGAEEIKGVILTTLLFAAIGVLDDVLVLVRRKNDGLPGRVKLGMQAAVGLWLYFWLEGAPLPTPYITNLLLPLPPPFVWVCGSPLYLPLTVFTCCALSNGVNLTDGLDGLAAGTSALAFVAMAVAVMPVYPTLGAFGAAMAGACVGFLAHNRNKASVFMGDTGSLALGGALAAMAAVSGMFLPLFIASGVFVIETVSVILQVGYFKLTKRLHGTGKRLFKMTPFHHHLELSGWSEINIVIAAYFLGLVFAILAAYVGLISA